MSFHDFPVDESLAQIIEFYSKTDDFAPITLERFHVATSFYLLLGSGHATIF